MYELAKKIEPRAMLFLFAGIVVLVAAMMTTLLVLPEYKRYVSANELTALLKSTRLTKELLSQPLVETKQIINELKHVLHGEMANLPIQQLESFIIGKLQEISWESKMDLVSIRPLSGSKVRNFKETIFEVELTGKYPDFFDWLLILKNELGFVVIKRLDIKPNGSQESNPNLSVSLTMVSYRMVEDE